MLEPVLQAAWEAFLLVFSWPNIIYPIIGTLLAMLFAFVPGISGFTLMALAISFTLKWEPLPIMLLFGAFVGGATFMGSVTAILFNIPGTTPSTATMIDGHPMAQQGKARTAIGCSATSSALGSTFGIVALILLIPFMRGAILIFGSAEFLMLAIWGLATIVTITRGSVIKGLAAAGIGFLISFIGVDPQTAELRYTFGSLYLQDKLGLVPILLGLFAIAEITTLSVTGKGTISGKHHLEELGGSLREGVLAVFQNFGLFLRSSLIGTVIGMIPAVGGTVASFVAYGQAVLTARTHRENFGHGDIRGVIAPEAAHDAKDGASLVPTLAFGIPGNEGTALLLGALTLHGLAPGKELMTQHLTLVFVLIWSLFLSNWLTSILGVAMVKPLAKLTVIRTELLAPIIFALAALGAYLYKGRIEDVAVAFLFGVLGYGMKKYDWPRIPLVIALVLGPLFESNLHITIRLHQLGRINFWTRPVTLSLMALTVATLTLPYIQALRARRAEKR
ncbi:MAG: tripartite tricarboxylate transporter permease [Acidobacteria bacterium]|nr:tripartite tricarboxylate transporter permease [Acidobacteriota bacterium]